MNKLSKKELLELILYNFDKPQKRKYNKKVKEEKKKIDKFIEPNYNKKYEPNDNNLDDFTLNFGLNYLEPKKRLEPKKPEPNEEENNDWFDIGSGHSKVQSVLIPKNKFTKSQAINYIKEHFKYKKIDETKNYYRFRQFKPKKNSHYISKKISNGVILVIEYDGEMGGSLPVSIIYNSINNGYKKTEGEEIHNIGDDYILNTNLSSHEIQVYVNENEKRIIINFVGTYKALDWLNNYQYVMGNYRQTRRFRHAKETVKKVINEYPSYQISLIGHSQSAVITREMGKDYGNKIFEIINLNGANLREKALPNEYNIRSSIDVVSLLTRNNDRVITIPREGVNLLKEHSPSILNRLNPSHLIGV
jgi:hypothetical protein